VKDGLRATIGAMLIATARTGLRGVPRVNLDDGNTPCLCFVLHKRVQLRKRPAMQASFVAHVLVLFTSSHPGGLSDVGQILKNDGSACRGSGHNPFTEDMIVVSALPKPFLVQLLEVLLRRTSAFGLQFSLEAEETMFLLFPSLLSQELSVGSDCRAIETQINSNHVLRRRNNGFRKGNNDVKREASLAQAQVSTTHVVANVLHEVRWHLERHFYAPVDCGKTTAERLPLDPVRTLIIADTDQFAVGTADRLEDRNGLAFFPGLLNLAGIGLFLLDLPREGRLDRFRCLETGRTDQLSGKIRKLGTQRIVRAFVQLHAIATGSRKTFLSNSIKTGAIVFKRCLQTLRLLWRRIELYDYRSIHAKSMSYRPGFCQTFWKGEGAFLPIAEARGLLRLYDDQKATIF